MSLLMFRGVVLGEFRRTSPAMPPHIRKVRQRLNSLSKISKYRREHGLELGQDGDWSIAIANVVAAMGQEVTVLSVAALRARLGLPEIDAERLSSQIADVELMRRVSFGYPLRTPAQIGALLGVSSVEREEARVIDIDAVDENATQRRQRLDRERRRAKRAALKAGRQKTQKEMADEEGVSLSTWKRRRTGELKPVPSSSEERRVQARNTRAREKADGKWLTQKVPDDDC